MKADALNEQGLQHKKRGDLDAAEKCFRHALRADPRCLPALGNLAVVLRLAGRQPEAVPLLEKLVALAPGMPAAHYSLANVYADLGRYAEAIQRYQRAIGLNPDAADAWVNMGNVHMTLKQFNRAISCFRHATALRPDMFEAQLGLAQAGRSESLMVESLTAVERALSVNPKHATAANVYADMLKDIGLGAKATEQYRHALALKPDDFAYFDALLMNLTYLGVDHDEWFAEHRRYGRQREAVALLPPVPAVERRRRDRLRIGYVSGDFRAHPIACFTWPLIKAHDRNRFEVSAYFTGDAPDHQTALFQEVFDHWLDAGALSDEQLAARIRADEIDILIDLSSHSALGRLGVFARRPAPVQATWLGYAATTGLTRIDWRITDAIMDPPGRTECFHTENLFRLPGSSYCFVPSPDCPPAGPLPAARTGRLTLASFNNSAKLTPSTVALWSRVLQAVPEATLRLFMYGGDEAPIAAHARQMFAAHGIAGERIEPFGKREFFDFLRLHQEVDLALDPLSFSGVTTTLYTLWMGVPVVTLPGLLPVTRAGASLLSALDLDPFVAASEDDYIAIVRRAAADPERLAELRDGLRARMEASPLLDHQAFTRRLEAAYRQMWQAYLDGTTAALGTETASADPLTTRA